MNVLAIACHKVHCRLTAVIFMAILPTVVRSGFVRWGRVLKRRWRKSHEKEGEEIPYEGTFACWARGESY